jgi:hypothetical protein
MLARASGRAMHYVYMGTLPLQQIDQPTPRLLLWRRLPDMA